MVIIIVLCQLIPATTNNSYVPALFGKLRSIGGMSPPETETLPASIVTALIATVTEEEIGLSLHTETSSSPSDSDARNTFCLKLISKTVNRHVMRHKL